MSWRFRPPRISLKRTKPKNCGKGFYLRIDQFRNQKKKRSRKITRNLNLKSETSQTIMQSLAFPFCLISVRGNDTQFFHLKIISQLAWKPELDVSLCTEGIRVPTRSYASFIRKNKRCFSPENYMKRWFWSTTSLIRSKNTSFSSENHQNFVPFSKRLANWVSNLRNNIH